MGVAVRTETALRIHGSADTIFRYAAQVERWPRILPHYRDVRVLGADGPARLVEMKARRGWIPLWWCARQTLLPEARRIRFTHVRGITRGMEVEWRLDPAEGGEVAVSIVHDLRLRWPLIGAIVARAIIGPMFVEPTARATLGHIKRLVEAETAPAEPFGRKGAGGRRQAEGPRQEETPALGGAQ
jgi:ribosome-associated toxin RatA of RatAB toxin-antitoxin module